MTSRFHLERPVNLGQINLTWLSFDVDLKKKLIQVKWIHLLLQFYFI